MSEAGIVIVTHQSAAEIGPCLDAALTTGAEIVVIDNASSDQTCATVTKRSVRLIANPENLGFAAAVNQGIRALDTPFVLLLNPDARLEQGFDALCDCCRREQVAAACGKLVDESGRPQAGFSIRSLPSPAALIFEALLVNRLAAEPLYYRAPVDQCFQHIALKETNSPVQLQAGSVGLGDFQRFR